MTLQGTIVNGKIVLDEPAALPEGATVRVEVIAKLTEEQDAWLRRLRSIATDCGVSLSNDAVSSEGLYD